MNITDVMTNVLRHKINDDVKTQIKLHVAYYRESVIINSLIDNFTSKNYQGICHCI